MGNVGARATVRGSIRSELVLIDASDVMAAWVGTQTVDLTITMASLVLSLSL